MKAESKAKVMRSKIRVTTHQVVSGFAKVAHGGGGAESDDEGGGGSGARLARGKPEIFGEAAKVGALRRAHR